MDKGNLLRLTTIRFNVPPLQSQMENPTVATIRPIPESAIYFAPPSLRKVLAPGKSFTNYGKTFRTSKSPHSSISSSLSDVTFESSSAVSSKFTDRDVSGSPWGTVSSKSSDTEVSASSSHSTVSKSKSSDNFPTHISISYTVSEQPTKSPLELLYPDI